jgi:hypothetical protein
MSEVQKWWLTAELDGDGIRALTGTQFDERLAYKLKQHEATPLQSEKEEIDHQSFMARIKRESQEDMESYKKFIDGTKKVYYSESLPTMEEFLNSFR